MERRQKRIQPPIIDPQKFGVSFSVKQCHDFQINPTETLDFLLQTIGLRRFRLMSYWNEHEKVQGTYDFSSLDQQIEQIEKSGGVTTLCLGVRQPRWPESHWPNWVLELTQQERYEALYAFITAVVERYKTKLSIQSYQLENEALNRSFGLSGDFNRKRLKRELKLVKQLDPTRPVVMSTSNIWGLPVRQPRPDLFGFTFYQVQFENGTYSYTKLPTWWWNLRAKIIKITTGRSSFIHELQAEPWGPKAIWEMPIEEQNKSTSPDQLAKNIQLGRKTNLYPIDLWGGEWWYWRYKNGDSSIYEAIKSSLID